MRIGAVPEADRRCRFAVWAPDRRSVEVKLLSGRERLEPLRKSRNGLWRTVLEDVPAGTDYLFRLDGRMERPDPASHFQPAGVHGPSRVVDHRAFAWTDREWAGCPLENFVVYELHVGTFTPEGTFDAVIPRLDELVDLGVTAVELMPVAQFPGGRNWGYDGVYPFAVQESYGGPDGLKRLIDACHAAGLAVVLDVVYNHLGPEGNYLGEFGPYFTRRYVTPWGQAVNYDGAGSDQVRDYFIDNALHWFARYHVDALRLDAVHGIYDFGARPFLRQLADRVRDFGLRAGRRRRLIAESDLNDVRIIRSPAEGGYGLDAQWLDDFHHALHALLTGERSGYYADFGRVRDLAKALREGYVISGEYSRYRRRRHGSSSRDRPAGQFVVFAQNHDQVGGRMDGRRLSALVPFEALKLAAAAVLLSPCVPLLFMGEEYGETAPFQYFTSHSDAALVQTVRDGRKDEFRGFGWAEEPPDPQDAGSFERSKLVWELRASGGHRELLDFHRACLGLRRLMPVLAQLRNDRLETECREGDRTLVVRRGDGPGRALILLSFNADPVAIRAAGQGPGRWRKRLDSADVRWGGPGPLAPDLLTGGAEARLQPWSCVLYEEAGR